MCACVRGLQPLCIRPSFDVFAEWSCECYELSSLCTVLELKLSSFVCYGPSHRCACQPAENVATKMVYNPMPNIAETWLLVSSDVTMGFVVFCTVIAN